MKYYLLFLVLIGSLASARAQAPEPDHAPLGPVVSVGSYGPSANIGVQVEQRLGRHFSLSLLGARYFTNHFRGYQGALAARYYFRPTAPAGLYIQALAGTFTSHATVIGDYPPGTSYRSDQTFNGNGGSLGLGYQLRFAQHLTATIGIGIKVYPTGLGKCDCSYEGDWYATGQPGSVLDSQLSVGYAF
jgi:hypothetical protein